MQASVAVRRANGRQEFYILDQGAFRSGVAGLAHAARQTGRSETADRLLGRTLDGRSDHEAVCDVVDALGTIGEQAGQPAASIFVEKCREYGSYLAEKARALQAPPAARWREAGLVTPEPSVIGIVVGEVLAHCANFSSPAMAYQGLVEHTERALTEYLPKPVKELRQEANLNIVYPFFERSLDVPGDACEFGCFRGILSIKLAWMLKARGANKHYYTFDTFEGFEIADPGGGVLGVGAFKNNDGAFETLTQWSRVLPLTPVKGDATKTVAVLERPLSFVWLDLDMAVLMDPVLRQIWSLCGPDTIIGIDDVGRPETPTVAGWLDKLLAAGAVEMVFNSDEVAPNTFIRVVRKKGELPGP